MLKFLCLSCGTFCSTTTVMDGQFLTDSCVHVWQCCVLSAVRTNENQKAPLAQTFYYVSAFLYVQSITIRVRHQESRVDCSFRPEQVVNS
jgi:hypothetical protein